MPLKFSQNHKLPCLHLYFTSNVQTLNLCASGKYLKILTELFIFSNAQSYKSSIFKIFQVQSESSANTPKKKKNTNFTSYSTLDTIPCKVVFLEALRSCFFELFPGIAHGICTVLLHCQTKGASPWILFWCYE